MLLCVCSEPSQIVRGQQNQFINMTAMIKLVPCHSPISCVVFKLNMRLFLATWFAIMFSEMYIYLLVSASLVEYNPYQAHYIRQQKLFYSYCTSIDITLLRKLNQITRGLLQSSFLWVVETTSAYGLSSRFT